MMMLRLYITQVMVNDMNQLHIDYCIIVVDAWKHLDEWDIKDYPDIEDHVVQFGALLNHTLKYEYKKGIDIYFCNTGRELMDEIDENLGVYVNDINDIPKRYKKYYFCGFHYDMCIDNYMKKLNVEYIKKGVLLNLSALFPTEFNNIPYVPHYLWNHHSIKEIKCVLV